MTALELLKSRARSPEKLVLITSNPAAQRIVAAWPDIYRKPFKDMPIKANADRGSVAAAIWGNVRETFAMEDLADQADVPVTHCEKIFVRLIRAGLLYPDGTVSEDATDFLAGQVRAVIRGMLPRGKTR